GFPGLLNRVGEVPSPKELGRVEDREVGDPAQGGNMEGPRPHSDAVSWTEVYSALQSGVVDGMENPPGLFYISKFYEQQKYLTVVKHLYSVHTVMINDRFFSGLSKEHQDLVAEAGRADTVAGRKTAIDEATAAIVNLQT